MRAITPAPLRRTLTDGAERGMLIAVRATHTIAFVGDVMLGRGVDEQIPHRTPESGSTLPTLRGSDAVIANLECAITSSKQPWVKAPRVFFFGARPAASQLLQVANVRCVALANNHTLDFREEGLLDTLRPKLTAHIPKKTSPRFRTWL